MKILGYGLIAYSFYVSYNALSLQAPAKVTVDGVVTDQGPNFAITTRLQGLILGSLMFWAGIWLVRRK